MVAPYGLHNSDKKLRSLSSLQNFRFVGSTIRGYSLKDAAAMRRYILHGKIYQDDLWLQKANASTSEEGFGSSNFSSTLEPLVVASTTRPALNSQKQLFVAPPQRIPANAERHDMAEVIRHHGQVVDYMSSHSSTGKHPQKMNASC